MERWIVGSKEGPFSGGRKRRPTELAIGKNLALLENLKIKKIEFERGSRVVGDASRARGRELQYSEKVKAVL